MGQFRCYSRGCKLLLNQNCNNSFKRSSNNIDTLFAWLDRDSDTFITSDDFILGVSLLIGKDVNLKEVDKTFSKYSGGTGKINVQQLKLAMINGYLDETFKDETLTETFGKAEKE